MIEKFQIRRHYFTTTKTTENCSNHLESRKKCQKGQASYTLKWSDRTQRDVTEPAWQRWPLTDTQDTQGKGSELSGRLWSSSSLGAFSPMETVKMCLGQLAEGTLHCHWSHSLMYLGLSSTGRVKWVMTDLYNRKWKEKETVKLVVS